MAEPVEWVRIERTFDASIEAVWSMWADPEHFARWYGPNGASVPELELDVRPGGARKICMAMETPQGAHKMWFTGQFKDVEAPRRLTYTESMCDEAGNILSPQSMGMPEGHPDVTEVIVELSEFEGGTRMKLTHVGVPADSGGAGGWSQAFDKLAAQLR